MWKTQNGGQSWVNVSDGFYGGSVGAVAGGGSTTAGSAGVTVLVIGRAVNAGSGAGGFGIGLATMGGSALLGSSGGSRVAT